MAPIILRDFELTGGGGEKLAGTMSEGRYPCEFSSADRGNGLKLKLAGRN